MVAQRRSSTDEEVLSHANTLALRTMVIDANLSQAWTFIREMVQGETAGGKPTADAKAELLDTAGLQSTLDQLVDPFARSIGHIDGAMAARPGVLASLNGDGPALVSAFNHVRANVGLAPIPYSTLATMFTLSVTSSVVDLNTGTPRDEFQDAANTLALAWNGILSDFGDAIVRVVETIQLASFRNAPAGLVDEFWSIVNDQIVTAASALPGGKLAARVGLAAIKNVGNSIEGLDVERQSNDKAVFINALRNRLAKMKAAPDGERYLGDVAQEFATEFRSRGASAGEDAYKSGDQAVVGVQAEYLKSIKDYAREYQQQRPTTESLTASFLAKWVTSNHIQHDRRLRLPLQSRRVWDGFVSLPLVLDYSDSKGWHVHYQHTAALHCPNSGAVAETIMQTHQPFDLSELAMPLHVNLSLSDAARVQNPPFWNRELAIEVRMNDRLRVESTWCERHWNWVLRETQASTKEYLRRITQLSGT